MYSSGVEDENYLRGIAKTDGEGTASVSNPDRQDLADRAPAGPCKKVYATSGSSGSVKNGFVANLTIGI